MFETKNPKKQQNTTKNKDRNEIPPLCPLPPSSLIYSFNHHHQRNSRNCQFIELRLNFNMNHHHHHHHHHHLYLNREDRWGTADDFTTSFLHFSLFSTTLWDVANSRPVHSLMLSSHLFLCLHCLLPPFTLPCKMALGRPDERVT